MTMNDLYIVADIVDKTTWDALKAYGRPRKVGRYTPPEDLYNLTYADLIEAQEIAKSNDIQGLCRLILGMSGKEYGEADAAEVMAFGYWVASELESIGKLFASLKVKPTSEQQRAGIDKLDFGLFGTLDWYCLRMGITDHTEAEKVPWIRIYKCMQKDNELTNFNDRLRKIYELQSKQKQQRRVSGKR